MKTKFLKDTDLQKLILNTDTEQGRDAAFIEYRRIESRVKELESSAELFVKKYLNEKHLKPEPVILHAQKINHELLEEYGFIKDNLIYYHYRFVDFNIHPSNTGGFFVVPEFLFFYDYELINIFKSIVGADLIKPPQI